MINFIQLNNVVDGYAFECVIDTGSRQQKFLVHHTIEFRDSAKPRMLIKHSQETKHNRLRNPLNKTDLVLTRFLQAVRVRACALHRFYIIRFHRPARKIALRRVCFFFTHSLPGAITLFWFMANVNFPRQGDL